MIVIRVCLMALFPVVGFSQMIVVADDPSLTDTKGEISFALRALQANREQLSRGAFSISGVSSFYYAHLENEAVDGEVAGFYAFDVTKRWQRFDMRRPVSIGLRSRENPGPVENREVLRPPLNSVRQGDYFAWYHEVKPNIRTALHVDAPETDWSGGLDFANALFDVRAAGLSDFEQFQNNTPFIEIIESLISDLKTLERDGDLCTLSGGQPEFGIEIVVVLDAARDYLPVSVSTSAVGSGGKKTTRATWEQKSDVWVPTSLFVELVEPWEDKTSYERFEYDLAWTHVNTDMPSRFFTFEDFPDVEDGVRVVDRRGAEPKLLGIWQDGKVTPVPPRPPRPDPPALAERSRRWNWINLAVILLGVVAWQWWTRRRSTIDSSDGASGPN